MNLEEFRQLKIGDRVICTSRDVPEYAEIGTIHRIENYEASVEFYSSRHKQVYYVYISFEGIERMQPDNQKIVITTDGKTTTAKYFDGKKLLDSAEAKCNPTDTFDFGIGAKLAFDRLTRGAKEEIIKENKPFVVGERVQFKTLDEMVKEFGIIDNHIGTSVTFRKDMSHLCGTYTTVEKVGEYLVSLTDFSANGKTDWLYSTEMIKHIDITGGKK